MSSTLNLFSHRSLLVGCTLMLCGLLRVGNRCRFIDFCFPDLLFHDFCRSDMLDVYQLQKIAYAYFGSLRERQVEPQSALRFLSPILSSLASSSSADRVAFASKNLFRFYGWARVQLVPSAIASDSTAEYAWLKTDNPLSAFASTVFAVIEKSPKLSSEGLLGRLTYALQHEPRSKSYKLDSIAQLVVREGLSLDQLTITLVSLSLRD